MFDRVKQWANEQRETGRAERTRTVELTRWVKEHRSDLVVELAGLHVFPDRLVTLPAFGNLNIGVDSRPIGGVVASLQQTGTVYTRGTLTRAATVGGGWQKTTDDREAWLQVDGPDFQWTIQVPQRATAEATRVAAVVTRLGAQAARG